METYLICGLLYVTAGFLMLHGLVYSEYESFLDPTLRAHDYLILYLVLPIGVILVPLMSIVSSKPAHRFLRPLRLSAVFLFHSIFRRR